jgi:aminoglycoside 6-adenylyltransferase
VSKIDIISVNEFPISYTSQTMNHQDEATILQMITRWAEAQPLVRAVLLTSTRAVPNGESDILSDYDVILVLSDILPFHHSRDWLEAFGTVLVMFRDPLYPFMGFETSGNIVQFEDGLKIDFTLWPPEVMAAIKSQPELIPELDAGYKVLLDKDGLAAGLLPPTYRAYIPTPPDQAEYHRIIEVFFLDVIYVAKYLWRGDLAAAKFVMECDLMQEHLRPMLEWQIETEHNWSVKPGPHGRRLQTLLRSDLWNELTGIYTGPGLEENWQGLHRTIALMRKASIEVGNSLGYTYPEEIDRRSVAFLAELQNLERGG